jgi:hypothetical protein
MKTQFHRLAMGALVALLGTGLGALPDPIAAARSGPAVLPAVVRLEPASAQVAPGGLITVSVVISQVSNLYGADVRLSFDSAVLAVVDADAGQSGVQLMPGPLLSTQGSGMVFLNQALNATGNITYVSFLLNPAMPFTGTGVLALVRFQGVAAGASAIAFTYAELSTNSGQTLPYVTEPGRIVVADAATKAWFPAVRH